MTSISLTQRIRLTNPIQPFPYVRRYWSESKWFRRALIAASVYAVLRLLLQLVMVASVFVLDQDVNLALPDDLRIYLEASANLQNQVDLYPLLPLERMEFYQYAPSFALAFRPFLWLPTSVTIFVHTLLHLGIYALLYGWWGRIFNRVKFEAGLEMLARLLPLWLVFAPFWSDLGYLNVYILMALLATFLIEAVITENLGASVLWATVILQIKPQWAFMLAVPLVLRQWRFFIKLLLSTSAAYVITTGITVLLAGSAYGWKQYTDYFNLLIGIGGNYPWREPGMPFLGYNHSIAQTVIYLFGNTPDVFRLATLIKGIILLPLVVTGVRSILRPSRPNNSQLKMDWAFALYAAAFIWLDVVWELSLGIVVFTYLLTTRPDRRIRIVMWLVFLPYALVDVIQLFSFLILGDAVMIPGPYILTDPSIYLPLTMFVTLVFYAVLVRRLWAAPHAEHSTFIPVHHETVNPSMKAEAFYQLSSPEISQIVQAAGVKTCAFPINGTRRWFMLERASQSDENGDAEADYVELMVKGHIDLYRMFFEHGISTLLTPVFGPDLMERGEEYTRMALDALAMAATRPEFLEFYDKYQIRVGIYGDYRKYLANTPFTYLIDLFDTVGKRTASYTKHRLFYGVFAHDATETIAELGVRYHSKYGRLPDKRKLVEMYYGEYVDPVSFFIGFDKFAAFDMPLVTTGNEDLYFTVSPSLYLNQRQLREILYDHIYTRRVEDTDYSELTPDGWAAMRSFYNANRWKTLGIGERHPSAGYWYPLPQVEL
jgi:adenosine tuberculosinyltransferase